MSGYKHAFSLSAQEVANATPLGTVTLIRHDLERTRSGRHEEVIDSINLIPKPSADPADPLNWPRWRKTAILLCMSLWAAVGNFQSAGIASAFPTMIMAFPPHPLSFATLTHLISVNVLFLGVGNLWWVPLAATFGRRPVILFCTLSLTLFSVWAAVAQSFDSLLAARALMGAAAASSEAVSPDVIGEVFFVHHRGKAMAIYTVFIALGPLLGGISGSYIAGAHGWRWINWVNVILAGSTFVLCFFYQPETLFIRMPTDDHDATALTGVSEKHQEATVEDVDSSRSFEPYTFLKTLRMGVYRGGLLRRTIGPVQALRLPGVWMVMFQYAGLVAGIVTISTVAPQLVSAPPYLWGANAGLINVGAILGSIFGGFYTYLLADRVLTYRANRESHGYTEPETRLLTQFPGLLMATLGIFIFGACAQHPAPGRWVGLQFGYGMLSFGLMQVPSVGFNYIIEAYGSMSGDCFTTIVIIRAIISFAWTFFVGDWIVSAGPMEPFGIFGMLMALFSLITVPIYVWGKRMRIATAKWVVREGL